MIKMLLHRKKISCIALTCVLFPLFFCGCMGQSDSQDTASIDEETWFTIADPIAENILQSINSNDYQAYTRDFSSTLLDQVDNQSFADVRNQIITAMGQYVSKERSQVLEDDSYVSVNYRARFEAGELIFRVVFKKDDESHKVEGVWFNNP